MKNYLIQQKDLMVVMCVCVCLTKERENKGNEKKPIALW